MRIRLRGSGSKPQGYVLLLTIIFGAVTLSLVASVLAWSANNSRLIVWNNQFNRTAAAAEAATEGVIARLENDYQTGGDTLVQANLAGYRAVVPTATDNSYWSAYRFGDDLGQAGKTQVTATVPLAFTQLASTYSGLSGYATTYQVVSDSRDQTSRFAVTAGVQQTVQTATIPLFQFAAFYNMDMEINPGPDMTISGPVHSNGNIYTQPQATLTFQGDVTSAGSLIADKMPDDPTSRTLGTIGYQGEHDGGANVLSLPIGTNNSPAAVRQVMEIPPSGESATSALGKERFYNKADLIIKVTDTGVVATSGLVNNFATTIPSAQVNQFVNTDVTFFNKRENATVKTTQIDIGKLAQWNATNTLLRSILPLADVTTLYVSDQRTQTLLTEPGVRLINGQTLLPHGLTVATPDPLYVVGNYNAPSAALGTADTSGTLPAALIADAVTILSPNWNDLNGVLGLIGRNASDVTVNAAILTGIVPTVSGSYSGGLENSLRFLEDWGGNTVTYNGSIVIMFPSVYAIGQWLGTGDTFGIYNPPTRNWAFDVNFRNATKLPPGTPSARVLIRASWATLRPSAAL